MSDDDKMAAALLRVRAMEQSHGELLAALRGLRAEAKAILGVDEDGIREAVGNTNVACLKHWIVAADAAIAKAEAL